MGRAIDMEKDIDMLKREVEKLNNIVRGMSKELVEIADEVDVIAEESIETKEKSSGKKKANTKGNGKSNKSDDTADGDADTESK